MLSSIRAMVPSSLRMFLPRPLAGIIGAIEEHGLQILRNQANLNAPRFAVLMVTAAFSGVICFLMADLLSIALRVRFSLGAYRIPPRDRPSHSIYFELLFDQSDFARNNRPTPSSAKIPPKAAP